jgi:hypothetical protein
MVIDRVHFGNPGGGPASDRWLFFFFEKEQEGVIDGC